MSHLFGAIVQARGDEMDGKCRVCDECLEVLKIDPFEV